MKNKSKRILIIEWFGIICLSLIYLIPLLATKGAMYGDDLHFHLDRLTGLSNVFSSPINFENFSGTGQGVNLFYPWIFFYPFYLFYKLTRSFYLAWYIYLYLINIVTIAVSYYSAKSIFKRIRPSFVFALLYSFTGYRLDNILVRFATGEILAMAFIPLIFLGVYQLIKGDYKKWYILAGGMTLLTYSHLLSVYITSIVIGVILMTTFYFWNDKVKRLLYFALATIVTVVLTSFQTLAMLEQFFALKLTSPDVHTLNETTFGLDSIISTSLSNSATAHTIGLIVLVCLIFLLSRFNRLGKEDKYLLVLTITLLFATSNFMPWGVLKNTPIYMMQFAWRLLTYIAIFVAYLVAKQVTIIKKTDLLLLAAAIVALHFGTVLREVRQFSTSPIRNPWAELSYRNSMQQMLDAVDVNDYANETSPEKRQTILKHEIYLDGQKVDIPLSVSASTVSLKIVNSSDKAEEIILPFYFYKGQKASINGKQVKSYLSKNGSTALVIPRNKVVSVRITYSYTAIAKISALISVLSVAAFLLYLFFKR